MNQTLNSPIKDFFGAGLVAFLIIGAFLEFFIKPNKSEWVMSGFWNELYTTWSFNNVIAITFIILWVCIFVFVRKKKKIAFEIKAIESIIEENKDDENLRNLLLTTFAIKHNIFNKLCKQLKKQGELETVKKLELIKLKLESK